jgi:hypothetical protein
MNYNALDRRNFIKASLLINGPACVSGSSDARFPNKNSG